MANTFNSGVYPEVWETKLQERLDKPTNWKEVCDVIFSTKKIFNLPYMSSEFSAQAGTRGTAYGFSDFTLTNDTIDIATKYIVPVYIDEADLGQMTLVTIADLAERQSSLIDEQIESDFLDNHAGWTDFGTSDIGGGGTSTSQITVSISNIDDIVRGVRKTIIANNGLDMMNRFGVAFVWRPADFEILEAYLQANGFNLADQTLKNGIMTQQGYFALGAFHYVSNSHTANHLFAGVKKIETVGILSSTFGKVKVTEDPNMQSGKGVITRVDYGFNTKAAHTTLVFDVNVA